jgi:hypothetical protein
MPQGILNPQAGEFGPIYEKTAIIETRLRALHAQISHKQLRLDIATFLLETHVVSCLKHDKPPAQHTARRDGSSVTARTPVSAVHITPPHGT